MNLSFFNTLMILPLYNKAFEMIKDSIIEKKDEKKGREIFVNAQWAFGATGTGAPVRTVLYICIICILYSMSVLSVYI